MIVTNKINVDLARRGMTEVINAVQTDAYSRNVEITLLSGGVPWAVPDGSTILVSYLKPDGTKGIYDTLPDNSAAWSVSGDAGNILTVAIAPQVLTEAGCVTWTVSINKDNATICTFPVIINVEERAGLGGVVEKPAPDVYQQILQNYVMLTCRVNNLSTLKEGSTTGDAELQDIRLGYNGQIYANAGEAVRQQVATLTADVEEVRQNSSILTATEKNLILRLFSAAVYTSDQSKTLAALQQTFESISDIEYTVANNLTNVQTDNNLTKVTQYAAYVATLTVADGYDLESVTVLMGGVDVTETVYADGEIYIPVVTGAIVITAVAVVPEGVISCAIGRIAGATGEAMDDTTIYVRSDFIPFDPATPTMLVDATINGNISASFFAVAYDANKNWINNLRNPAFSNSVTPAAESFGGSAIKDGWGNSNQVYTALYPDGIAYVRLCFASPSDVNVTSFSGTTTISGIEYQLGEV